MILLFFSSPQHNTTVLTFILELIHVPLSHNGSKMLHFLLLQPQLPSVLHYKIL